MDTPAILRDILKSDVTVQLISDGIWSTVESAASGKVYDKHAAFYDRLIGSKLYNRIAWGTSPNSYARFAKQAIDSGSGTALDAGCGSLVSTVDIHVDSDRPTVLCDLSAGMLTAARDRIVRATGQIPSHLLFLQADITQLPFEDGSFGSILCPGMLHIFEDLEDLTHELARVAATGATLFMSSLVAESWISSRYLDLLHRAGEVARPRTCLELISRLSRARSGLQAPFKTESEGSMLYLTAAKLLP